MQSGFFRRAQLAASDVVGVDGPDVFVLGEPQRADEWAGWAPRASESDESEDLRAGRRPLSGPLAHSPSLLSGRGPGAWVPAFPPPGPALAKVLAPIAVPVGGRHRATSLATTARLDMTTKITERHGPHHIQQIPFRVRPSRRRGPQHVAPFKQTSPARKNTCSLQRLVQDIHSFTCSLQAHAPVCVRAFGAASCYL